MQRAIRNIAALLFLLYLIVLLKITLFRTAVTLFDVYFGDQNGYVTSRATAFERANFVPFYSVYYYLISRQEPLTVGLINVFGNIGLFIPFGFLLPLTLRRFRTLGSALLVMGFTSLVFEVMQMLMVIGVFDIDDVLFNIAGGAIGYGLFRLLCTKAVPGTLSCS
jgi:glycopeptide antibiotics resistance protein